MKYQLMGDVKIGLQHVPRDFYTSTISYPVKNHLDSLKGSVKQLGEMEGGVFIDSLW